MNSDEERLYAHAEMLDETGELAQAVTEVLTGAQGSGVDPRAVISLTAALQSLDPGASAGYTAGSRKDRQDNSGYGSDAEFLLRSLRLGIPAPAGPRWPASAPARSRSGGCLRPGLPPADRALLRRWRPAAARTRRCHC